MAKWTKRLAIFVAAVSAVGLAWAIASGSAENLVTAFFLIFVSLLVIAAATTIGRVIAKLLWQVPVPKLLWRDAVTMGGLTTPFLLILAARAGSPEFRASLQDNFAWILATSIPAIIGLATYVYFEIWVIGPPTKESAFPNQITSQETANEYKKVD